MVEHRTMSSNTNSWTVAVAIALALGIPAHEAQSVEPAAQSAPTAAKQSTYASAEEAAAALAEAVRGQDYSQDLGALLKVVGPQAARWIPSGDEVADRANWKRFLELYDTKHVIAKDGSRAILTVGDDPWPFPAPLVEQGGRWHFDAEAGREEVLARRVGRNELDTIQTLLAIVDAQREYASVDRDRNGLHEYAKRFQSTAGRQDGLYWDVKDGEPQSPLGPLIAAATEEGYVVKSGEGPRPYHGYLFRILTAQGPNARGGAEDYVVDGRLIGGFAVIAWPAKYRNSGIMTFLVDYDGVVYQKDLGEATSTIAEKTATFNPDSSWKPQVK
jgi:hypothetical protein